VFVNTIVDVKRKMKKRAGLSGGKKFGPPPERGPNPQGLRKGGKVFDPEGSGYDYETAKKFGIKPDESGHMPSRAPSGQILKGRKHKTYSKTEKGEKEAGYVIKKGKDDKYYSKPLTDYMGSFKTGGCVHRENGKKSDIKGISPIQIKGKKFIGVR
jgi:hypothetical protein